jgi:hypothetical protein
MTETGESRYEWAVQPNSYRSIVECDVALCDIGQAKAIPRRNRKTRQNALRDRRLVTLLNSGFTEKSVGNKSYVRCIAYCSMKSGE